MEPSQIVSCNEYEIMFIGETNKFDEQLMLFSNISQLMHQHFAFLFSPLETILLKSQIFIILI